MDPINNESERMLRGAVIHHKIRQRLVTVNPNVLMSMWDSAVSLLIGLYQCPIQSTFGLTGSLYKR